MATIYSIRDLESLSGIKAHTIRIWEQRYGILKANRTETNIRYYSETELKYLLSLALLNRNGHKISKLAAMRQHQVADLVTQMINAPTEYANHIDGLAIATIAFDEEKFERIIDTCILQLGFDEVMKKVVFPYLQRVGMLWVAGTVQAGQEHFMTQLLRQKLIVAIDGQPRGYDGRSSKCILFLPNGEWHELSLLFLNYLLRNRNHRVIYLGPSVPLNDVISAGEALNADYFFTIMTVSPVGYSINEYLNKLATHFPDKTIFVSGTQVATTPKGLESNVVALNSMESVLEIANSTLAQV